MHFFSPPSAALCLAGALWVSACGNSDAEDKAGSDATATGSATTSNTSNGSTSTSDGTTTGGAGGTTGTGAVACPAGSESMAPSLGGTPTRVMGVPPAGYSEFNLEGPVWISGALYVSEIDDVGAPPDARILKYVPGAGVEVFIESAGTNGLALGPDGQLYGAVHTNGTISRFDVSNPAGMPTVIAGMYDGKRFNSPNDLTLRRDGVLYFTDPDWQAGAERQDEERAYRVSSDGTITPIAGAPSKPNGISLSPDESTLYIGGTSPLMSFPVNADGSVGAGSPFGTGHTSNDGMGVDCAGNLYVTEDSNIVVLSPSGDELGSLRVAPGTTNVAFGGADRTTLYITKLDPPELYEVDVGIPGYPY